jgi:hypothetical protein
MRFPDLFTVCASGSETNIRNAYISRENLNTLLCECPICHSLRRGQNDAGDEDLQDVVVELPRMRSSSSPSTKSQSGR